MIQQADGSPTRKVRYAVVGLGYIAQVAVLPAFQHARRNSVLATSAPAANVTLCGTGCQNCPQAAPFLQDSISWEEPLFENYDPSPSRSANKKLLHWSGGLCQNDE